MPTGTGKSVVIAMFLKSIFQRWPTQKVMVLTHVKELIRQNYSKMLDIWPDAPVGINSAGLGKRDVHRPILFAGIASVVKYVEQFWHVDLVIIDEAHLVSPKDATMYQKFISKLKIVNPHLKVIGLTATPYRLGQGLITDDGLFTDICFDLTTLQAFNRLISEGYICPLVPKRTFTQIDTSEVSVRGGEFVESELQLAVDRTEITEAAVREAIQLSADRKHWLSFCAGIQHTINTVAILNSYGISAVAVHSKMSSQDRDTAIADWKAGRYQCAVNNNVLTTGIDFPGIDLILMLRPTISTQLWVQMLGRGTRCVYAKGYDLGDFEQRMEAIRIGGKRDCLVLDFAGNTKRLGPINDPVIPKKYKPSGGDAPVKICPHCATYNHASLRFCTQCGYEFPIVGTILNTSASTDELIRGDHTEPEITEVDHITYNVHHKKDRPDSVKVAYYCGMSLVQEFVCFEHEGYASHRARKWWAQREAIQFEQRSGRSRGFDDDMPYIPKTTSDAMVLIQDLPAATHVKILTQGRYPVLVDVCFDGTGFGTVAPGELRHVPSVEVLTSKAAAPKSAPTYEDDDIPF